MGKLLGLILMLLGIIIVALKLFLKQIADKIPLLSKINVLLAVVIGLILVVAGYLFLKQGGKARQASEEVPIYHGKKIVGYRRGK